MGGETMGAAPWRRLAPSAMLAAVTAWLWPIGVGGRMPVGGDVTQFSIGLMAVLGRALKSHRLPLWNDLWGFGFPGLAESQMGVYYPPHVLLYGLFSPEFAYTASLVIHTYWAALGAFWAARRFGVSPWGSALSGFSWAASGLFLVHLPHQWGYTTGSWMPWIVGLSWTILRGEARSWSVPILAGMVALQILPGHFQFAFETQVVVILMVVWSLIERPRGWKSAVTPALAILTALVAVGPLAAMQVWPTLKLAQSAETQRTFAYLSAFPASPIHLINYIAPNLFHLSPLWRPVAWDPLHAMPEEHRPYIGLIPLMLALGACRRLFRNDAATRMLMLLALGSLILSLGPYVPGFSWLIRLPGFSFFRAPARWGLVTELALAILAGKGFDAWTSWPGVGRQLTRFAALAGVGTLVVVAIVELAFASTEGQGLPTIATGFEATRSFLPWRDDPSFREVMASARRGPTDPLILNDLIRAGVEPRIAAGLRLDQERGAIYLRELSETGAILIAMLVLVPILSRPGRVGPALLILLTFLDLMILGRHRAVETAPIRPLTEQSTVLHRLAALPPGSRSIDGLRNLPMVSGAAPVSAYRTLDRPAMRGLIALAGAPRDGSVPSSVIIAAIRAVGASTRILDPFEPGDGEFVNDPALASWLYGAWGRRTPGAAKFRCWSPVADPARAWFVAGDIPDSDDPRSILSVMARAVPARFVANSPEEFVIEATAASSGTLIVSVLDDPEWQVTSDSKAGEHVVPTRPIFRTPGGGSWQAVSIAGAGDWRFRWVYRGRAAKAGLLVSGLAWLGWMGAMAMAIRSDRASRKTCRPGRNLIL
ncbi:MAG: hypothetical protein JWN86_4044 [Planctomycetota bacterium]|nr:hypothetical protein [Planctomycetota bacterium]